MASPVMGKEALWATPLRGGNTLCVMSATPRRGQRLLGLPQGGKVKRAAKPDSRRIRTDRFYLLALFLNRNATASLDPETCGDLQLAAKLLDVVARQPSLIPDIARMALSGSNLYGERRGETLSSLQQRGLVGQMLCRLIYQEESIPLRMAKLFAVNRQVTQKEFAAVVRTWPYAEGFETGERLWRKNYEAAEIPVLYLNSLYTLTEGQAWHKNDYPFFLDLDNLWVGSLTWTLIQFGARSIALKDMDNLNATSPFSMMELGLGLVALFRQGLLATGVEPTFHLGLLLYYLRARPELDLGQIVVNETLDPAFALLKEELENRHIIAQRLYDSVSDYQADYQRPAWRTRQGAAEELLRQYCGSASLPLSRKHAPAARHFRYYEQNPVRQLMIRPAGQQCAENGTTIPDLDAFYRQEVENFSNKIKILDSSLLAAAFLPSDFHDHLLQSVDVKFLEHAGIDWVIAKLERIRRVPDMFYSSVPVQNVGKSDTFFFQARLTHERRLFALRTTEQGYLLRRIVYDNAHLEALKPFMEGWPAPGLLPHFRFSLAVLNHNAPLKQRNETLAVFLERYAEIHYQSYRQKIYEQGYQAIESPFPRILDKAAGMFIPFYTCVNSLIAGQQQSAFTHCLVDGALVGLPLIFVGVKAGLGLYREAAIGAAETLGGPRFIASEREIFANRVPASTPIAGGVTAAQTQLAGFMDVMGKEVLKSFDPGFAALRSLSLLTKGVYLAVLGRTAVGLIPWRSSLAKITGKIPQYVSINATQNYQLTYGDQADTPLTINVKGISYLVLQIQNSSMVAAQTGERMPHGELMFSQLDLQSRFGIYKKYYCIYTGDAQCRLETYRHPDFKIEKAANISQAQDGHFVWLLNTTLPINLVVVHPIYQVEYVGNRWVLFEINGRRWAFAHDSGILMPADNTDEWHISPPAAGDFISMIDRGADDRTFRLRLMQLPGRRKRDTGSRSLRTWRQLLTDYRLDDEGEISGFAANIYDDAHLDVAIGEAKFLLAPEKNAATFLLRHPRNAAAPAFRVAYLPDEADFVFASPLDRLNSHRIGEDLRRKMDAVPPSARAFPGDILQPPLFNGAFRYGKRMFLKNGDRFLSITPAGAYYHGLPGEEGDSHEGVWTLRYELFTGSFELSVLRSSFHLPGQGDDEFLSRFEKLAVRAFAKKKYPTLAALCQPGNMTDGLSPARQSHLGGRLRQVALLLRLDPHRRTELLHASSVALRAFRKDDRLPMEWIADFHPLALWATLENVATACGRRNEGESLLASRQLAQLAGQEWGFPAPVLIAEGPEPMLFIVSHTPVPAGPHQEKKFVIRLFVDRIAIQELVSEDGFRRWLPLFEDPQRTTVTKHALTETQQPVFWCDEADHLWAQTPDGVKRRLLRNDSRQPVDDIIVSPDGATVVVLHFSAPITQRALFYAMPAMGARTGEADIAYSREVVVTGSVAHGRAWWVTDRGELFVPRQHYWSLQDDPQPRWRAPEGYQPDFVSPDQRFLGYSGHDSQLRQHEIMLIDTVTDNRLILRRGRPFNLENFRLGKVVSVAFSALNALVAVGFSDGYIEIYRIDDENNAGMGISLGGVSVPEALFNLAGISYPKQKQMVLQFNNAFDRLLVFHDIGEFSAGSPGNGSYAMAEIYLSDAKKPDS
ncbi:hypothetical protein [Sodalis sp. RH19]|uniref:hypothetical protein n=1 Tax=Sodalis sp. RH19 TaxID=3394334 RepID=UPI0039B47660